MVLDLPRFGGQLRPGIRVSGLMAFYPPAWCHSFVRPLTEPFFHPGPHDGAAVARSGALGGRLKGLSLTAASTTADWCASGLVARRRSYSIGDR
jgi:hypothetical protein